MVALLTGVDIDPVRLRDELTAMLPASMQLSLVEVLAWEMFPIGITGKTLKRVFRERTESCAVVESPAPSRS